MKDDFYIGWSDEVPGGYRSLVRKAVIAVFVLCIAIVGTWQFKQTGFANSTFEYGIETTYEGTIFTYPAPLLRVNDEMGYRSIPLVNFGKSGVNEIISNLREEHGDLSNKVVKLKGTKIQFDNKTWLELTEGENSILSVREGSRATQNIEVLDNQKIKGEIVDPKCFFGVMKPGFGKVHMSCAIRCISGGIPAILTTNPDPHGERSYYFVAGSKGESVNSQLVPFIGMPVAIEGTVVKVDDWYALELTEINNISAADSFRSSIYNACNLPVQ